jgi:hypothetical protein
MAMQNRIIAANCPKADRSQDQRGRPLRPRNACDASMQIRQIKLGQPVSQQPKEQRQNCQRYRRAQQQARPDHNGIGSSACNSQLVSIVFAHSLPRLDLLTG